MMTLFFLKVMYSTPLSVLHTMLINGIIAYLSFGLGLSNRDRRNVNFYVSYILNKSFLINSYTKFFLSSGAI